MAPQKRSRRDDDEEVIAVESARSNLRPEGRHKKPRLSVKQSASKRNARDRDGSPSSDSDDNEVSEDEGPALPPSTQYEEMRDGNWEHVANPDVDDEIATQRFMARSDKLGDNRPAENAIIEEITCVNFMCHERLHVPLGPLINFIVGMNGSGKSAVLTAITLCLGGKATSTNRGSSLKSLIKQGETNAALIIKLKNKGADAYQPDVFGESIIIERHFTTTGSSGFKLKNATGRLISNKKGDVDDIVEHYQLQVDNPMNVLTQDAAKTFITASTPAQKYQFFHKGVQLEALDNDYKVIWDTCENINEKLNNSEDDIKDLKKIHDEWQEKVRAWEQNEGLHAQGRAVRAKLAWIQVADVEAELQRREQLVEQTQTDIEEWERKIADEEGSFQAADEAWERGKAALVTMQEERAPLEAEEEEARSRNDGARKEVEKVRTDKKTLHAAVVTAKNKVKGFESDIEKEKQRIEAANGGAHSRKLEEVEQAKQALVVAQENLSENLEALPELNAQCEVLRESLKKVELPFKAKNVEIHAARERLQGLNSNRGDVIGGYDNRIANVLTTIRNDRGFREKPVGPLGLHIKLLNPAWSNLLESMFNNTLTGFIVTGKADQSRLSMILKKAGMSWCPVYIGNDTPIDTRGHEPDEQFETILRALEIDNNLVKRHLIITLAIDQTILVDNREKAFEIMYSGTRPRNVRQCFCPNPKKRGYGIRLGYLPHGRDVGWTAPPKGKPRMKTDIDRQIQFQRETVNQLEDERKSLESECRQARMQLAKAEEAVKQNKSKERGLRLAVQRVEDHIETLTVELESFNVAEGRLDGLKTCLRDAESELTIAGDAYGNIDLEMRRLNDINLARKKELDAIKARLEEHDFKISKAEQKVTDRNQARTYHLMAKNNAIEKHEQSQIAKGRAEAKRDQEAARVATFIQHASEISPRVGLDRGDTLAGLEKKAEKIKAQLEALRKRVGASREDVNNSYLEAKRILDQAEASRAELKELFFLLKTSLHIRLDMFKKFQSAISARSRINFSYLLSERLFRGKLLIDHKKKLLEIHVEPDGATKSGKGRKAKTLSGGEKSFSNICLLLSLWEAMGAPLRCLDEFDVFMDDVNRDVSTRMIILAARRSVGRQFVLITPKALGAGVTEARDLDVRITKLFDPRQKRIDEMMDD